MTDIAADAIAPPDAPDLADDEQRERWKVRSDRAASWALRRLGEAQAEVDRIKQAAADEIDMLKAWRDAALSPLERDINFFEGVLIEYRMELEASNERLPQTYKVPGGAITRRKTPDKIEIIDEDALVRWAIRNGLFDLLKTSALVSKLSEFTPHHDPMEDDEQALDPVGKLIAGEGEEIEIVPGVVHLIREDTYGAKPEKL